MKFSQTLALNANPDWANHYLDFSGLKKVINELNSSSWQRDQQGGGEKLPSVVFLEKLGQDMESVRDFFIKKRQQMDEKFSRLKERMDVNASGTTERTTVTLVADETNPVDADGTDDYEIGIDGEYELGVDYEANELISAVSKQPNKTFYQIVVDLDKTNELTPLVSRQARKIYDSSSNLRRMYSVSALDSLELEDLQREICDLYTQYHNLQLYGFLNVTGLTKILKKYDKIMGDDLKTTHMKPLIQKWWPFWIEGADEDNDQGDKVCGAGTTTNERLQQSMNKLQSYFAHFFCGDDMGLALKRMQLLIREYVSYQRHSIWLDVIQDGQRREAALLATNGATSTIANSIHVQPKVPFFARILSSTSFRWGLFISLIFFGFLFLPDHHFLTNATDDGHNFSGITTDDVQVRKNALALLVLVSLLWAAEVLPLFCTALLVPFLAVVLRVMVVDGVRLSASQASKHVFASMFSHVILLLLGGFSIAAALSKHGIAKRVASYITQHALAGGSAGMRTVVLVYQFIATIASMWISNVAAPVLCYSLMAPIFKAATAERSQVPFGTEQWKSAENDRNLCRALVMGVALASNVGGMASPISSPQNLFAIEYTPIGWIPWFIVSVPLCITLNLLIWMWLVYCYQLPANTNSMAVAWAIQRDRPSSNDPWTDEQYFVVIVSVGVVILWCASVGLSSITGEMGILAIVPLVLFFGTGILSIQDLNNFLWSVVLLAMGGLVLGDAVAKSGLLESIAQNIAQFIQENSLGLWQTLCIFTGLILVCTTFVSHTVGAIVVLPICSAVGSHMLPVGHPKELVFAGALACSAAMGLPVSGFPNMTAVGIVDHLGNRFLTTKDFLKVALPASILAWMVIVTLGYALILLAVRMDHT